MNNDTMNNDTMNNDTMNNDIFSIENDEYMWHRLIECEKTIVTYSRRLLNCWAIDKYNIDPKCYKNKRLLLQEFINIWNDYFYNNPEFKKSYEEHYGTTIYL